LLCAALVIASPLQHQKFHKKDVVIDIITDIVFVTVTEGDLPTSSSSSDGTVVVSSTVVVAPVAATTSTSSSSSSTSSIEIPSTTEAPAAPSTTSTPLPPPAPTTTEVVEPAATSEVQPIASPTAQAAAQAAAPATASDPFVSTGVSQHNTCRAQHSASDAAWNSTLAQWAANTASTCVFAHDMTQGTGNYGQNIAAQGSSQSTAWTETSALQNAIVDEWYSEESMFTALYGQPSPSNSVGDFLHFTQIVWKDSTEVGCAVQACPLGNSIYPTMYTWFTVCNYYPQGNVEGYFNENVLAS